MGIYFCIRDNNLIGVAILCFVGGLYESNMTLALSGIVDLVSLESRAKYLSYAYVMCSLGYISGSIYGGITILIGYALPFMFESIGLLITGLLVKYLYTVSKNQCNLEKSSFKTNLLSFLSVFNSGVLRKHYLANFIAYLAIYGLFRVMLIYLYNVYKLNSAQIAFFYGYASLMAGIANFVITPLLLKKRSLRWVVQFALIGGGVKYNNIYFTKFI